MDPLFALTAALIPLGIMLLLLGGFYMRSRSPAPARRRTDIAIGVGTLCVALTAAGFFLFYPLPRQASGIYPGVMLLVMAVFAARFVVQRLDEPWSHRAEFWVLRPLILAAPLAAAAWAVWSQESLSWLWAAVLAAWAAGDVWRWFRPVGPKVAA